jgi:hypothetical protein
MARRRSNGVSDAWRDLEVYYERVSTTYGKRWKDHVSDLAAERPDEDSQRATYEKQTNLRIRALAKDEQRAAERDQRLFPLRSNEPVSSDPGAQTWGEVYGAAPGLTPDAETDWDRLCALAETEAQVMLARFSLPERFGLGCKSKRIALYLPEVLKTAPCSRDALYEAANQAETKYRALLGELQAKYAEDSAPDDLGDFLQEFKQVFLDRCQESVPPEILRLGRY